MAEVLTEDLSRNSETKAWNYSFIAKLRDFSNEAVHKPGKRVNLDYSSKGISLVNNPVNLHLHANWENMEEKGYISAVFKIGSIYLDFCTEYYEFICFTCVIDAHKNKRFSKSYVFQYYLDSEEMSCDYRNFAVDQLLECDTLFNSRTDLLPGDCLSLQFDFIIKSKPTFQMPKLISIVRYFYAKECKNIMESYSRLTSLLYLRLGTVMFEYMASLIKFPSNDYPFLKKICFILVGEDDITVKSVDDICQMFRVAHEYDVLPVIETCKNLFITMLQIEYYSVTATHIKENIETLLKFADMYVDVELKEHIQNFLNINPEDFQEEIPLENRLSSNLSTEWKLELIHFGEEKYFQFTKNKPEVEIKPEVQVNFNFYQ